MPNLIEMVMLALMFGVSLMAAFIPIGIGIFALIKLIDYLDKKG